MVMLAVSLTPGPALAVRTAEADPSTVAGAVYEVFGPATGSIDPGPERLQEISCDDPVSVALNRNGGCQGRRLTVLGLTTRVGAVAAMLMVALSLADWHCAVRVALAGAPLAGGV
jgi:hypothetical protein